MLEYQDYPSAQSGLDIFSCTGCEDWVAISDEMYEHPDLISSIRGEHMFCDLDEIDVVSGTIIE